MIRVNLARAAPAGGMPSEITGDFVTTDRELRKQGLIRLLILVMFPLGLYAYQESTVPALIEQRNAESSKLSGLRSYNAQMDKSVQEIKKFKEDEAKIQARIAYLERLSKERFREIKIVDLIQQVIPEKVWLTRVESSEGRILISGLAMTDFEISSFMEAMAKSVYFADVNLMNSAELTFDGLTVKRFEIACSTEKAAQ